MNKFFQTVESIVYLNFVDGFSSLLTRAATQLAPPGQTYRYLMRLEISLNQMGNIIRLLKGSITILVEAQ
jgi:hypothetical protein